MFINNRWIIIMLISIIFISESEGTKKYFRSSERLFNDKSQKYSEYEQIPLSELEEFIKKSISTPSPMEILYEEPTTQWLVEDFLRKKIGSEEIVDTVLLYASENDLPIKIVFSLVFVESTYSTSAINNNKNNTQDRGLFQLNSRTFRHLTEDEFFHLETNVKMGTSYLAYAYSFDPDPVMALSIYNAGPSRPLRGQTPTSTKAYVKKILANADSLEREFTSYLWTKINTGKKDKK